MPNVDSFTFFVANFIDKTYPDVDKQFNAIQKIPTHVTSISFPAAAIAPNNIIPNATITNDSGTDPKKYQSPKVVAILVTFLKIVTIGTELHCKAAMLVNSIIQKTIFTGAHCFAVAMSKLGYSTHFIRLQKSTQTTATIA